MMAILPRVRGRHLLGVLIALLLGCAAPAHAQERPFASWSFWNARVPNDAPRDSMSALLVADLQRQVRAYGGAWMNTDRYAMPVYEVGADQPTVPVRPVSGNPDLAEQFAAVPLPEAARGAFGTDRSAIVWQRATNTLWEFWRLGRDEDGGWHAHWGGRITNVSNATGIFRRPFGVSAGGVSLLGGMIRPNELASGVIGHALGISVPDVTAQVFRWPANRTDGRALGGIPMGTRFRLDPSLDVEALGLTPAATAIALAVQRYGMVVKDTGGVVAFYGEDPASIGSNPYPELFDGLTPSQMLAGFPWDRLQVLAVPSR